MPEAEATAARLRAAGCVAAEDEAAELVAWAPDHPTLEAWTRRRESGEPLAWITGRATFCTQVIGIVPGVFVPRPQTEQLARRAAAVLGRGRAVDLCTGTGAVARALLTLAPNASVVAVDIDPIAVECARGNGVSTIRGDLAQALVPDAFDVVTAVPPYVPTRSIAYLPSDVRAHEPIRALDGGDDGLETARRVVAEASRVLHAGGWLFIELGADQDEALAPVLERTGFGVVTSWFDDDDDLRGVAAQRS